MPIGDVVQSAGTISGIALALAALLKDEGWKIGEAHVIPIAFLLAGLISLLGASVAMSELWRRAGLNHWSIFLLRLPQLPPWQQDDRGDYREALLVSGYGLYSLGVVYVMLLFNLHSL